MIATFEELRRYLNRIPNINYGGCGLSALVMYRWLKKNGFDCKIYFLYDFDYRMVKDDYLNMDLLTPFHVLIGKDNFILDSHTGEIYNGEKTIYFSYSDQDESRYCIYEMDEESLVDRLMYGHWNRKFEKEYHFDNIVNYCGIDLSDIEEKYLNLELNDLDY
jgi:hypothetical protein